MFKVIRKHTKKITSSLILTILFEIIFPLTSLSLTDGPVQGNFSSFEAANSSEMVNLFNGDFKYNLSLLDVGGYPINIFYDANVSMDQEASWVGFGWNLNAGSLVRNMRGLPDDFDGDLVKQTLKMKEQITDGKGIGVKVSYGANGNVSVPIGPSGVNVDIGASVQKRFEFTAGKTGNNYSSVPNSFEGSLSYGKELSGSIGVSYGFAGVKLGAVGVSAGVSSSYTLSYNGYSGMTFQMEQGASLGVYAKANLGVFHPEASAGVHASASLTMQSRKGLTGLDVNSGYYTSAKVSASIFGVSNDLAGRSRSSSRTHQVPLATRSYTPGIKFSMSQNSYDFKRMLFVSAELGVGATSNDDKGPDEKLDDNPSSFGFGVNGKLSVITKHKYKSSSKFKEPTTQIKAYGHYNAHKAKGRSVLLDFNRLNDGGSISANERVLPLSVSTNDMYSATGQGVGMNFNTSRSDVGTVYDNLATITTESGITRTENVDGASFKFDFKKILTQNIKKSFNISYEGEDVEGNSTLDSYSSYWSKGDDLMSSIYKYCDKEEDKAWITYEPSFYKPMGGSMNWMNDLSSYYGSIDQAVRLNITNTTGELELNNSKLTTKDILNGSSSSIDIAVVDYTKLKRVKRQGLIEHLNANEAINYSLMKEIEYFDAGNKTLINGMLKPTGTYKRDVNKSISHHVSEFSVLNEGGSRYYYGIPVYNKEHRENLMSVELSSTNYTTDYNKDYTLDNTDDGVGNSKGKAKYFSSKQLPAYASSYLLTATTSPNFVDLTGDGLTKDDLGDFTKFNYTKIEGSYSWRSNVGVNGKMAASIPGAYSDTRDDMAAYTSGERDQWYIHSIETKEYVAIFHTENRKDAYDVDPITGEPRFNSPNKSKLLRKIELFSKADLTTPIKVVHFTYDYTLCKNLPNALIKSGTERYGKLTLKSIYFTTGKSDKSAFNPYTFEYNNEGAGYDSKKIDRWGNYDSRDNKHREFPYANQNKFDAAEDVANWCLTKINLPSGGSMQVEYESDEYSYVNDKRPQQMYQIIADEENSDNRYDLYEQEYITIQCNKTSVTQEELEKSLKKLPFVNGEYWMYFKGFVYLKGTDKAELQNFYVPIDIQNSLAYDRLNPSSASGPNQIRIKIKHRNLGDKRLSDAFGLDKKVSYISYLTMQNARNNYSEQVYGVGKDAWDVLSEFMAFFEGVNKRLYRWDVGRFMDPGYAYVRLPLIEDSKIGGGKRVKSITHTDNWSSMSNELGLTIKQEYLYGEGVLNYEVANGGDDIEKTPYFFENFHTMAPDDLFYNEGPVGDQLYPSGSVGYSNVRVKNSYGDNNIVDKNDNKPGDVEYLFYTTRDFPYFSTMTDLQKEIPVPEIFSEVRGYNKWKSTNTFHSSFDIQVAAMSQGFLIRTNDMHGKLKEIRQYDALGSLLRGTKYNYKSNINNDKVLENRVPILRPDNTIETERMLFVETDAVNDSRSSINNSVHTTKIHTQSIGIMDIVDVAIDIFTELLVERAPIDWKQIGRVSNTTSVANIINEFKSNGFTKVVSQSGILVGTESYDVVQNSKVISENLLWDSETGAVILQKTTNQYYNTNGKSTRKGQELFSFEYPAHWTNPRLGGAYQNYGIVFKNDLHSSGKIDMSNYGKLLFPGDELMLMTKNTEGEYVPTSTIVWVISDETIDNEYYLIDRSGAKYTTNTPNTYFKVIRSGAANMASASSGSILLQDNPISIIGDKQSLSFTNKNVLMSNAMTYDDKTRMPISNTYNTPSSILVLTDPIGKEIVDLLNYMNTTEYYNSVASKSSINEVFPNINIKNFSSSNTNGTNNLGAIPCTIMGDLFSLINSKDGYFKSKLMNCEVSNSSCIVSKIDLTQNDILNKIYINFNTNTGPIINTGVTIPSTNPVFDIYNRSSMRREKAQNAPDPISTPSEPGMCSPLDIKIGWEKWGSISFNNIALIKKLLFEYRYLIQNIRPIQTKFSELPEYNKFEMEITDGTTNYVIQGEFIPTKDPTAKMWQSQGVEVPVDLISCLKNKGDIVNPYVTGLRGQWHVDKSYVFKEGVRTKKQTNSTQNGTYLPAIFEPFWKYELTSSGGSWKPNPSKYQVSGKITIVDQHGYGRESKSLNNIYSAVLLGYNNRLPVAQASNAQLRDIIDENFEEYMLEGYTACGHGRFDFSNYKDKIVNSESHTGKNSLRIDHFSTVTVLRPILPEQKDEVNKKSVPFTLDADDNLLCFSPRTRSSKKYMMSYWQKTNHTGMGATSVVNFVSKLNLSISIDGKEVIPSVKYNSIVDGWQKVDVFFDVPILTDINKKISFSWKHDFLSDANLITYYIDDIRIQPLGSVMQTSVYDPITLRKMADLNENNFATFYEYDNEGNLVRIKQETIRGIQTIQETRSGLKK